MVEALRMICMKMKQTTVSEGKRGCSVEGLSFLHNLHSTKPELKFCAGSNPAHSVLKICDGENLWQWARFETERFSSNIPPKKSSSIVSTPFGRLVTFFKISEKGMR